MIVFHFCKFLRDLMERNYPDHKGIQANGEDDPLPLVNSKLGIF